MRTDGQGYSDYLREKYLPGRRLYLRWFFYPKIFRRFSSPETIIDLGCGTGEFLGYCRRRRHDAMGVDSNSAFARRCREEGFKTIFDNICRLSTLNGRRFKYAICDNVLEHLDLQELGAFFARLEALLAPGATFVCIVPGTKGFKCDPTHKTFISQDLLTALLKERALRINARYFHPINLPYVDKFFYLNMQVFEIAN